MMRFFLCADAASVCIKGVSYRGESDNIYIYYRVVMSLRGVV